MSRLKTIKVEVPEGAEAGDSLTFSAEGKEIEFPIPDGSKPGDVLQIQIQVEGGEDDDDNDVENDDDNGCDSGQSSLHDAVTKVELHSSIGASLAIHNSIPGVPSPNDDENEKKDGSDGTSSMAWPAAPKLQQPHRPKPLEGLQSIHLPEHHHQRGTLQNCLHEPLQHSRHRGMHGTYREPPYAQDCDGRSLGHCSDPARRLRMFRVWGLGFLPLVGFFLLLSSLSEL